jgi:hypothetical protein
MGTIGHPTDGNVGPGVECQTAGFTSLRWHNENIDVPIVLTGERYPFPIRRKNRKSFMAARRQLSCITTVTWNAP